MKVHSSLPSMTDQASVVYLASRSREWDVAKVAASARARSDSAATATVAVFDVLGDLFTRADREARSFVTELARMSDPEDAVGDALLVAFKDTFLALAVEARFSDPEEFASACGLLLSGATTRAIGGDLQSALRARDMARDLLQRHRATGFGVAQPFSGDVFVDFDDYDEASMFDEPARQPGAVVAAVSSGASRPVQDFDDYLADLDALGERFG
jgi:hypothetical protein